MVRTAIVVPVEVGQVRQIYTGPDGSVPYRIMCKDWVRPERWIIQSLMGYVQTMDEETILKHHVTETEPQCSSPS